MNPSQHNPSDERRHSDHGRRIADLETRSDQTFEFRRKVEHALFDEEGNSRIRMSEERTKHIELALFDVDQNGNPRSRIAAMQDDVKGLLQFADRGKFITAVIWAGLIGLGSLLGSIFEWVMKHTR